MLTERAANGTLLLDLNKFCFDDDSDAPNNKFNFTTPSGVGSSRRFSQHPAGSGRIVLFGDLDYENPSNLAAGNKYSVIVQVQDAAPPYYKNNIYISILTSPENEYPLIFDRPSYMFDVSETRPAGTQVGRVRAVDEDLPQRNMVYSITSGGASLWYPKIFWINPKTGELRLVTKVDHETTAIYILTVEATNGEDTSSVTITVHIIGENDEKPVCTPNFYFMAIPVDLKVGTNIKNFKLTCTDLDSSPRSFRYSIGSGNINSHFTFSPSAGSNVTRLLLSSHFDYAGGLDKIWDYKLLVYITDDNLLSGRTKAEAVVKTGTVTLSVKVIPHPTSIIATAPRPRITYQILRENTYSPSAWYVPFIITLGSMALVGLLGSLMVMLAKAIYRYCSSMTKKDKKPPPRKKRDMKNVKKEAVVNREENSVDRRGWMAVTENTHDHHLLDLSITMKTSSQCLSRPISKEIFRGPGLRGQCKPGQLKKDGDTALPFLVFSTAMPVQLFIMHHRKNACHIGIQHTLRYKNVYVQKYTPGKML
ncbi:cadherin-related family member 3 [Cricetulus griseus]|uniref:Cadherin-related family member 3 n=1 Tax=Cricetulus griseus TaxID=10029 RepID=A0A061HYX7_CRIGR|nr:cadherin-related family member 3 [Cricetulus griseus]